MKVTREMALEIFGLTDNFSKDELKKAFIKLSKLTHPDSGGDANLFRFIMDCKAILANEKETHNLFNQHKEATNREKKTEKEVRNIELFTLFEAIFTASLYNIMRQYIIEAIVYEAEVHVTPIKWFYKNKKQTVSQNVKFSCNFKEFLTTGKITFAKKIELPEHFKKFKKFELYLKSEEIGAHSKFSRRKPNVEMNAKGNLVIAADTSFRFMF